MMPPTVCYSLDTVVPFGLCIPGFNVLQLQLDTVIPNVQDLLLYFIFCHDFTLK